MAGEPTLLRQALAATTAIDHWWRTDALIVVAGQPEGEPALLRQVPKTATAISNEDERVGVLAAVARRLEGESMLLCQALVAATAIDDKRSRADALAAVVRQLEGEARRRFLRQALGDATSHDSDWGCARALAAVAGQLAGEPAFWKETLPKAERMVEKGYFEALLNLAATWQPACGYPDLGRMLNEMPISSRSDWLGFARALAPVIVKLGGKTALGETATAIQDTVDWWP